MPPATVVSITEVRKFVAFTLNATDAYGGALDDPKYAPSAATGYIDFAILNADAIVVKAIMENPEHPKRSAYLVASTGLATGALIPEHLGPIGDVRVDTFFAVKIEPEFIVRWNRSGIHTAAPSAGTKYFGVSSDRIYHTGASAVVDLCTYTLTTACQAPSEYTAGISHLALAEIFKLGARPDMSSHHLQLAMVELQGIVGSVDMLPKPLQ